MKEWPLYTVLSVYRLIEAGEKKYDTRAPDTSNADKNLTQAKIGDIAQIVAVDENTFERLDLPILRYEVCKVQYFSPEPDNWEGCVTKMLNEIGIEKVFPGYTLEEAINRYKQWPSTSRIVNNGIVILGLGKRLE